MWISCMEHVMDGRDVAEETDEEQLLWTLLSVFAKYFFMKTVMGEGLFGSALTRWIREEEGRQCEGGTLRRDGFEFIKIL